MTRAEAARAWRRDNPERVAAYNEARRAAYSGHAEGVRVAGIELTCVRCGTTFVGKANRERPRCGKTRCSYASEASYLANEARKVGRRRAARAAARANIASGGGA